MKKNPGIFYEFTSIAYTGEMEDNIFMYIWIDCKQVSNMFIGNVLLCISHSPLGFRVE